MGLRNLNTQIIGRKMQSHETERESANRPRFCPTAWGSQHTPKGVSAAAKGAQSAQPGRAAVLEAVGKRLTALGDRLEPYDDLVDNRFSAANLLMTTVLRSMRHTNLRTGFRLLDAFRLRGEARSAFQKALAD